MARALAVAIASGLSTRAVAEQNYSMYCKYECGGNYKTECHDGTQCPPLASCSVFAFQPFYGGPVHELHEICKEFGAYGPDCDGTTKQCKDADSFQLVCDRENDISRDFQNRDWYGVGKVFADNVLAFSPGGSAFMPVAQVQSAYETIGKSAKSLDFQLKQVFAPDGKLIGAKVVHAVGVTTLSGSSAKDASSALSSFTRWELNVNGHWVVESMVMEGLAPSSKDMVLQDDELFHVISSRSMRLSDLYNAKNYTQIVDDIYADGAVFVPREGKPVGKNTLAKFFSTRPLGEGAKLSSKIVTKAFKGDVAHEIGFSDSTQAGYYTRWILVRGKWLVESQCFAIFPKASTEIVV
eukprot:TRINITY_DN26843_c0_g1_i1.p1 TRINITY_DN26843_c0_g1~~TRINITY_DN26843_c0_g1_i1.p1  ORF type:complete len:367 (-),score=48.58 TRINITY_DN26843_c0_g1_i1:214-1269(-)